MLQKLPVDYDFIVYRGATFRQPMRWSPSGAPQDFTGWDAWMPIGPSLNDEPLIELNVANGGIKLTADGHITIYMSDEETTQLAALVYDLLKSGDVPMSGEVGELVYNLSLKQPNGDVIRFMRGNLFVQWDVGRPK